MILQKICIVPVLRSSRDRTRRFEAFFFAHNLFFCCFSLFSSVFKSSFRFPISPFFYFLNNFRALEKVLKNDFLLFFWNSLLNSARSGSEQFSLLSFFTKKYGMNFFVEKSLAQRESAHTMEARMDKPSLAEAKSASEIEFFTRAQQIPKFLGYLHKVVFRGIIQRLSK